MGLCSNFRSRAGERPNLRAAIQQVLVTFEVVESQNQPFPQGDPWMPAELPLDQGKIRIIISDIDPAAVVRESGEPIIPPSENLNHDFDQFEQGNGVTRPEIEHPPRRSGVEAREQQGVYDAIHVVKIS